MSIASLCVIIITPFITGEGTVVCTPAAFITVAGMYYKIITVAWQAHEDLITMTNSMEFPAWVNDCLQPELQIDQDYVALQKEQVLEVAASMESLTEYMFAYFVMVCALLAFPLIFGFCVLSASIYDGGFPAVKTNIDHLPIEAKNIFFNGYKFFN